MTTKKLRNLLVGEVSLVDKGANNKRFYLMKAAETQTQTENGAAVVVADVVAEKAEPSLIEKALAEAVEGEAPDTDPSKDLVAALRRVAKATGLDDTGLKAVLGLKDPAPVAVEKAETASDPLAGISPEARILVDGLFKTQADAVAKAASLTKALDEEREAKAVTESIQKAAADFKHLAEKPDVLGPALRALRKADAVAVEVIENVLKRADALAAQSLEPKGVSPAQTEDASGLSTYEKVAKRAEKGVSTGEFKTIAEGVARIFAADPALYTAHEAEKKG